MRASGYYRFMRESGYYRVKDKGANVWDIGYYEDGVWLYTLPCMGFALFVGVVGEFVLDKIFGL